MKKLIISVEDVKNELDLDLTSELGEQAKQVDKWLMRVQRTILNYIAQFAYGGMRQVENLLQCSENVAVVREAIIEQIDFISSNNFVQTDKILNVGGQSVEPTIAPLAHQILANAGLLYAGAR